MMLKASLFMGINAVLLKPSLFPHSQGISRHRQDIPANVNLSIQYILWLITDAN